MAFKDIWVDRVDGVDDASADDINLVAHTIIEHESDEYIDKIADKVVTKLPVFEEAEF